MLTDIWQNGARKRLSSKRYYTVIVFVFFFLWGGLKLAEVGPEIFPGVSAGEFYPAGNGEFFHRCSHPVFQLKWHVQSSSTGTLYKYRKIQGHRKLANNSNCVKIWIRISRELLWISISLLKFSHPAWFPSNTPWPSHTPFPKAHNRPSTALYSILLWSSGKSWFPPS